MSYTLATIAANLVAISCAAISGLLAYQGKEGWGWFLFAALVTTTTVKFTNKTKR